MLDFLNSPIARTGAFQEADEALKKGTGPIQVSGAVESLKAYMMVKAGSSDSRLLVSYDEGTARRLFEDYRQFDRNVSFFPSKDILFYEADARSNVIVKERLKALRGLFTGECKNVVTTFQGLMNVFIPKDTFLSFVITLQEGQEYEVEALTKKLVSMGYERVVKVEDGGEFSVHGGIVDIFDMTQNAPYRIDFFGDEIDTIRTFSVSSQISGDRVTEPIALYPATEFLVTKETMEEGLERLEADYEALLNKLKNESQWEAAASLQALHNEVKTDLSGDRISGAAERFMPYFYENTESLLDYFPEDRIIALDEPQRLKEYGLFTETEFVDSFQNRLMKGLTLPKCGDMMRSAEETLQSLDTPKTIVFSGLDTRVTQIRVNRETRIDCRPMVPYTGHKEGMVRDLLSYAKQGFSMAFIVPSKTRGLRMTEELREAGVSAFYTDGTGTGEEELIHNIPAGTLLVTYGALHKGFVIPQEKFVLLTEDDVVGGAVRKKTVHKEFENGVKIRSFSDLSFGDYVVHETYGIGIYQGIVNMEDNGIARDYVKVSYGNSGTLYVPVTNFSSVQKYAGSDSRPPRLSRLDSPEWGRTKARVRAAVQEVAEELVTLYATRENIKGHAYRKDTEWQREFEEMFPFEETQDQLRAISEVKSDMESGKIMDRLLCGDVGFGKTEVAIRAAFKAVQEGKQVAYLVPTTILAKQHYNTFKERLKNYPVTVEMLSRFTSTKDAKRTVKGLSDGMTDIVIGTHKILSKNISFKDLGLLIIDEEQRFGVKHKEAIKQLRKDVDVLTLTATPIPRTLHMSMIGIRDMSVLSEPPEDRKAIQTYVMEYQEELVREAILRETARGGQVYYVYNRAMDISEVAGRLQRLLPDTSISYVHGKMKEEEIDKRMLAFIEGETDVLVSTTIIETGIDIPNVNTIIICDAERYGLAQLYQLRGRVGRSTRQAYAFIMYRKNKVPTEEAEKRLQAIRQFTELGSGIRIATEDLEIRGAGTVLGNAQSGHMTQVGYDLYSKMLKTAVLQARGEMEHGDEDDYVTTMDIVVDAYIPDRYLPTESEKLELYKRISLLANEEEAANLLDELVDRFGEPPKSVKNLMLVAILKTKAHALYLEEVKGNDMDLTFTFVPYAKIDPAGIPALISESGGRLKFKNGEKPQLIFHEYDVSKKGRQSTLEAVENLLVKMKEKIAPETV